MEVEENKEQQTISPEDLYSDDEEEDSNQSYGDRGRGRGGRGGWGHRGGYRGSRGSWGRRGGRWGRGRRGGGRGRDRDPDLCIPSHIQKKVQEKLTTPEEILKFREERRSRYPTKQNIQQKIEERQQRLERGELLDIPNINVQHQNISRPNHQPQKFQSRPRYYYKSQSQNPTGDYDLNQPLEVQNNTNTPESTSNSLPPLEPTSQYPIQEIKKDIIEQVISPLPWVHPIIPNIQLTSTENEQTSTEKIKTENSTPHKIEESNIKSDPMIVEDSQRHNIKSSDVDIPDSNDNDEKEENQNASTQYNRNFQRPPPRYQNFRGKRRGGPYNNRGYKRPKREDLLRDKLMEDSIRNERIALLQCIRYVVSNNFFQTSKPAPTPSSNPS